MQKQTITTRAWSGTSAGKQSVGVSLPDLILCTTFLFPIWKKSGRMLSRWKRKCRCAMPAHTIPFQALIIFPATYCQPLYSQ